MAGPTEPSRSPLPATLLYSKLIDQRTAYSRFPDTAKETVLASSPLLGSAAQEYPTGTPQGTPELLIMPENVGGLVRRFSYPADRFPQVS